MNITSPVAHADEATAVIVFQVELKRSAALLSLKRYSSAVGCPTRRRARVWPPPLLPPVADFGDDRLVQARL